MDRSYTSSLTTRHSSARTAWLENDEHCVSEIRAEVGIIDKSVHVLSRNKSRGISSLRAKALQAPSERESVRTVEPKEEGGTERLFDFLEELTEWNANCRRRQIKM